MDSSLDNGDGQLQRGSELKVRLDRTMAIELKAVCPVASNKFQ